MRFLHSCLICGSILAALSCAGCKKGELVAPLENLESELHPGMSPEHVEKLLGKPEFDQLDPDYTPQLIRKVKYQRVGLYLTFHTQDGLFKVSVEKKWNVAVCGAKVGEVLEKSDIKDDSETFYGSEGLCGVHHLGKWESWPDARYLYVNASREINAIVLEDRSKEGKWDVHLKK
jgi:hypothetical protein